MTQEEWIEKYKDEIWVPKAEYDGSQMVILVEGWALSAKEPVRLFRDTYLIEVWQEKGLVQFEIEDNKSFLDCYEPLSASTMTNKKNNEYTYRFREMFIPDDSFTHGRMCLGVIAVSDKSGGFESWINPERADYLRGIQMEQYLVDLYQRNWINYVKARFLEREAKDAFIRFPQEKRGVYISSKDMELKFCGEDRFDIEAQMIGWQGRYFEEANKKKVTHNEC